jgi:8-oxo-dGTP diphosphatase
MIKPISIVIPYYHLENSTLLWVQVRKAAGALCGLLEFPGGKVEAGESPVQAASREVEEETQVKVNKTGLIKYKNFFFEDKEKNKTLMLMIYLYEDKSLRFNKTGYFEVNELKSMASKIPPNNSDILRDLSQYFGERSIKTET